MVEKTDFAGFPRDLFLFLEELSHNNNRQWFAQNKERYQRDVVVPVSDFISALGLRFQKISHHFNFDPRGHGGSMFRIYRDTRFSQDKRPYKDHVGCLFRHKGGSGPHGPCFYLHLQPGGSFLGAGIWRPEGPALAAIRQAIVDESQRWTGLQKRPAIRELFGRIQGERLARPPRGFPADHPLIEDLKFKTFFLRRDLDDDVLMNARFIDEAERSYKAALPFVAFFCDAIAVPA